MTRRGARGAFTLVECVAALALFALIAVMFGQTCFNCLNSVRMLRKNSERDAIFGVVRSAVLSASSLDDIRSGIEAYDMDGNRIEIKGDAEPTRIIDLFRLEVSCRENGYSDVFYLFRPGWYSQGNITVERSDMLDDRRDWLDDTRRQSEFK